MEKRWTRKKRALRDAGGPEPKPALSGPIRLAEEAEVSAADGPAPEDLVPREATPETSRQSDTEADAGTDSQPPMEEASGPAPAGDARSPKRVHRVRVPEPAPEISEPPADALEPVSGKSDPEPTPKAKKSRKLKIRRKPVTAQPGPEAEPEPTDAMASPAVTEAAPNAAPAVAPEVTPQSAPVTASPAAPEQDAAPISSPVPETAPEPDPESGLDPEAVPDAAPAVPTPLPEATASLKATPDAAPKATSAPKAAPDPAPEAAPAPAAAPAAAPKATSAPEAAPDPAPEATPAPAAAPDPAPEAAADPDRPSREPVRAPSARAVLARKPGGSGAWDRLPSFAINARRLERNRIITATREDPVHSAFDVLRTKLLRALRENGWTRVAVTSPTEGCGKTFLAANLAISLSRQSNCRSILMDLDMRHPALARALDIPRPPDLPAFLRGNLPMEELFCRPAENGYKIGDQVAFGVNGQREPYAAELLQDPDTADVLSAMEAALSPDVILFDMPPALVNDDVLAARPLFDGIILVVGGGITKPQQVRDVERRLGTETPLLGMVLNRAEDENAQIYGY